MKRLSNDGLFNLLIINNVYLEYFNNIKPKYTEWHDVIELNIIK